MRLSHGFFHPAECETSKSIFQGTAYKPITNNIATFKDCEDICQREPVSSFIITSIYAVISINPTYMLAMRGIPVRQESRNMYSGEPINKEGAFIKWSKVKWFFLFSIMRRFYIHYLGTYFLGAHMLNIATSGELALVSTMVHKLWVMTANGVLIKPVLRIPR